MTAMSSLQSNRPRIGMTLFPADLSPYTMTERRRLLDDMAAAGLDHIHCGDHVSFHDGSGWDGLISATTLLSLHDTLAVHLGLYVLPLRHPVLVARQLATLCEYAPGRLVFTVGVGGDDPREVAMCGIDPRTRGRRMDEMLTVLRQLLTGQPVTFSGRFFTLDAAVVRPAPTPPVPILVGGRSDAAIRRTAKFGDGWLGIWISAQRFASVAAQMSELADQAGRTGVAWRHGMDIWCGVDTDRAVARRAVSTAMEALYRLPASQFERWCPAGTPEEVAAFVAPYIEAGAQDISLIVRGRNLPAAIASAAEVQRLLLRHA